MHACLPQVYGLDTPDAFPSVWNGENTFALEQPPVAVDSHVTRWAQDELVQGSYSYQKVYSGSDMCESLATPEWGGRLCFAGQACCQTRVQCVDGALVTGRQAADSVATLLK